MTERPPQKNLNDLKRILPGILISVAALILVFTIVDPQNVLFALGQAEYKFLLLGLPIYLLGYIFRALAWAALLNDKVSFKDVFLTMQAGYFLNNVLPFRLGELGRALILGRRTLGFWQIFSTIIVERAFDMILAASLLLGTMPFVLGSAQSKQAAYIVAGVVLVGMAVLYLLARSQDWAIVQYKRLSLRSHFLSRFGVDRLQGFLNGLSALTHLPRFFRVVSWMVLSWGATILYHFIVLKAFLPEAIVLWAAFGLGIAALGVALPSSPSYIGIIEAAWVGALSLFNVPYSSALAYALTVHLLHILISLTFGIYALGREGESFREIYDELRQHRLK